LARPSQAQPKAKGGADADQAAKAIENALQRHAGDVHRCFAKVLADRLDAAGRVEVKVDVGKAGRVTSAKVQKTDKTAPPALAACIEQVASSWTIDGIEKGASIVLPFVFKAQSSQYVVNAADVPERALGGAAPGKGKSGAPKRDAPFTVKVLADETNVKAEGISVTLLSVGPASRVAMHRHPHSAKVLYLIRGHARLLGPEGVSPVKLDEGTAAFIPAGYPHVIENMGRQSTAVFLQAFSPPGPERVYRDPTDARGRAEFEVIRDPASAKVPADSDAKITLASATEVKALPLAGGIGTMKPLLDATTDKAMVATWLELNDGADLQGKADPSATKVLFFLNGTGTLKIGSETMPIAGDSMVYVPRGTAFSVKVQGAEKGDKVLAVELKVPAAGRPRPVAQPSVPGRK
jgi:mannose-6-phosphate isomerase-like protein (cupin superfamily)